MKKTFQIIVSLFICIWISLFTSLCAFCEWSDTKMQDTEISLNVIEVKKEENVPSDGVSNKQTDADANKQTDAVANKQTDAAANKQTDDTKVAATNVSKDKDDLKMQNKESNTENYMVSGAAFGFVIIVSLMCCSAIVVETFIVSSKLKSKFKSRGVSVDEDRI